MARTAITFRKRRTRGHIIADQSVNHVEKFLIDAGHAVTRIDKDYGYDLVLVTHSSKGYVQPGYIYLQLKASDRFKVDRSRQFLSVRLDRRDYNLWRLEPMPVFLLIYDATARKAYWFYTQQYFEMNRGSLTRSETRSMTVHVPTRNRFDERAVGILSEKKRVVVRQLRGKIRHV